MGQIIAMTDLVPQLRQKGLYEIQTNTWEPYLRYYHYAHDDGEVILFFNEDPHESVNTWVTVPMTEKLCWYDAFDNVLRPVEQMGNRVHLTLTPYQALILCAGQDGACQTSVSEKAQRILVDTPWAPADGTCRRRRGLSGDDHRTQKPGGRGSVSGFLRYDDLRDRGRTARRCEACGDGSGRSL